MAVTHDFCPQSASGSALRISSTLTSLSHWRTLALVLSAATVAFASSMEHTGADEAEDELDDSAAAPCAIASAATINGVVMHVVFITFLRRN